MIAFQSSRYNGIDFYDELDFTVKSGVECFDIFFDGYTYDDIDIKKLNDYRERFHLTYTVHAPISDYFSADENVDKLIKFVNSLKPYSVTVHFNKLSYEVFDFLSDNIDKSVFIAVENTIPDKNVIYNNNYIDFMQTLSKKHPDISATFDIGHCWVNKFDPVEYVNRLINYRINIPIMHVHDNNGNEDSHTTPGSGTINFDSFFINYKKAGMKTVFVIEHWQNNRDTLEFLRKYV